MAPYFPLYVRRSDGRLEISSKGVKELNRPSGDQLDNTPNAQGMSDFYRECAVGDKDVDWRRKLGGMLIRELGGKETRGLFLLAILKEDLADKSQTKVIYWLHFPKTIDFMNTSSVCSPT